jgi:hypothetical protein
MPSHYGKERSEAAASRATTQRLTAKATRALAAKKRKAEKAKQDRRDARSPAGVRPSVFLQGVWSKRVFGKVTPRRPGEAPELKAHGVRRSI